jgi:hypothetical protein
LGLLRKKDVDARDKPGHDDLATNRLINPATISR